MILLTRKMMKTLMMMMIILVKGTGGWSLYGEGLGSRKLLQAFIKEWGYRVVEWFPQQPEINWSLWWVWKLSI